jgi:hypothetical protein
VTCSGNQRKPPRKKNARVLDSPLPFPLKLGCTTPRAASRDPAGCRSASESAVHYPYQERFCDCAKSTRGGARLERPRTDSRSNSGGHSAHAFDPSPETAPLLECGKPRNFVGESRGVHFAVETKLLLILRRAGVNCWDQGREAAARSPMGLFSVEALLGPRWCVAQRGDKNNAPATSPWFLQRLCATRDQLPGKLSRWPDSPKPRVTRDK